MGVNLLVGNLHGSQIAWKYRACAGHVVHWIPDGFKRQAGKSDWLLQFMIWRCCMMLEEVRQRRQPWGELVGMGFASDVRTIPMPPGGRFVHLYTWKPLAVRGHLCRLKDHVSPF